MHYGKAHIPTLHETVHKARWMAKLIYCLKLELLSSKAMEELPKGSIFAIGQREKVHRFVQFAVHCYLPWWVRCRSAASAALNDLKLLKAINDFKKQDQLVADAALSAFKNHLWYLTEELVPLAFFFLPCTHLGETTNGRRLTHKRREVLQQEVRH